MGERRSGVSLLEVMVVVLLLGFAVVPLTQLGRSTHRQAFFTEHHVLAQMRARTIIDLAASVDFELYEAMLKKANSDETTVDLDVMFGAGTVKGLLDCSLPASALYEAKRPQETVTVKFTRRDASIGELAVEVQWKLPDQPNVRTVRSSRLLHRREVGTYQRWRL